ncbi:exodeoxyribonuclease VII large subunit [Nesterenkonia alba]|uniref:exodeoxyribonuclease VII large subunit n=1 Tax=Nesterenkonia alba TaxID=515814 RepID=UPI0003B78FD5|nr:exodeoxyribonuclease VII large subunit [Nesterenkonia alba]
MDHSTPQAQGSPEAEHAAGAPGAPGAQGTAAAEQTPLAAIPPTAAQTSAETPWPLSHYFRKLRDYLDGVDPTWIEGQLVRFKMVNGIAYMTLRDLEQEISFSALAWRQIAPKLQASVNPGARVVALVKPNLYERTGQLSLVTHQMREVGLGDLLARIEQLKATLTAEGLFAEDRKKPLPVLPQRIGVITGRDSDAKKDIIRNVRARWAAAEFEVIEVSTQGERAPMEVTAALAHLDENPEVDVVVIARGGGSLEDVILPFSDERLIRAVAAATTPVVSAIGHEADRPLLDEVADVRASTPTGSAKLLVPEEAVEREQLNQARTRMSTGVQRLIAQETEWVQTLRSRPALAHPEVMIESRAEDIDRLRRRQLVAMDAQLTRAADWVEHTRARITALSPQSTLDRGYAVVQQKSPAGGIVRDATDLQRGAEVEVMVASGEFTAEVTEVRTERTAS